MRIEFATVYQAVRERYRRQQAQRRQREQARVAARQVDEDRAQLRAYTRIAEALVSQGVYMPNAARWTVPIHQIAADPPRDTGWPESDGDMPWPLIEHVERMTPIWRERGYFAPQQSNLPEFIIKAIEDGSTRWAED